VQLANESCNRTRWLIFVGLSFISNILTLLFNASLIKSEVRDASATVPIIMSNSEVNIQCHKLKDNETRTFNIGFMNRDHCT